jgi:hypothetical protein
MANLIPGTQTASKENVITFWQSICKEPRVSNPCIENAGDKDHPFNDRVDDLSIFYLSSQREGTGQRSLNIPEGKEIFIPLLGIVATQFEIPNSSVADLKTLAKRDQDFIKELSVEFKGQKFMLQDLNDYIVTTDEFDVKFPDPTQSVFQGNCGPVAGKAVADGRYLILKPPLKGEELTIHIKGNILVDPGLRCLERGFNEDLKYTLRS